jgi:hypothetical protein
MPHPSRLRDEALTVARRSDQLKSSHPARPIAALNAARFLTEPFVGTVAAWRAV